MLFVPIIVVIAVIVALFTKLLDDLGFIRHREYYSGRGGQLITYNFYNRRRLSTPERIAGWLLLLFFVGPAIAASYVILSERYGWGVKWVFIGVAALIVLRKWQCEREPWSFESAPDRTRRSGDFFYPWDRDGKVRHDPRGEHKLSHRR